MLQGSQAGDFQDPEGWKDFLTKLTTSVLSTLSAVVSQYDENMKRLEAQRMMPGWNYCQFFVIKVRIAGALSLKADHLTLVTNNYNDLHLFRPPAAGGIGKHV